MSAPAQDRPPPVRLWLRPRLPVLLLAIGLIVTAVATYLVHRSVETRDRAAFDSEAKLATDHLQLRLNYYERVIRSTGSIFYIVPKAGPETFYIYVEGLDIQKHYSGIRGLGVTIRVPESVGRVRFEKMMRDNGMKEFRIWPETPRDEYHAIVALYPRDHWNQRAIGYDMHTNAVRAAAMDRARDTGKPAASGVVVLVQDQEDTPQPGFLIYSPLYFSRKVPPQHKRKADLLGYVYAPFRMREVFEGIPRREARATVQFEVTEGKEPGGPTMYRSWEQPGGGRRFSSARFSRRWPVHVADQWWTVSLVASPDYRESAGAALTVLMATSGSAVSLLLFGITLYQFRSQRELDQRRRSIELLNDHLRRAMRETHHRVKNNLQVVAAMIDMQAMDADETSESQLRRLSMHVTGLAAVHDILTDQARLAGESDLISARLILQRLLPKLEPLALGRPVRAELDDAMISSRQGTSLAIVTNELVSNAIKHGRGRIDVSFTARNGTAYLKVLDDGPGFPPGFTEAGARSTGLQLVESLSEWDLGGGVRFENAPEGGGALVTVELALHGAKNSAEKPQFGA